MTEYQQSQKKAPVFNEDATLRGAWRRVFARAPIVREIREEGRRTVPRYTKDGSRHKVDSVQYLCQVCNQWAPAKMIEVDHIIPVIDVDNISGKVQDWNEYKRRLFCEKKNLQRICDTCHDKKTYEERMIRQSHKDRVILDQLEERLKSAWTIHEEVDLKKQVTKFLSKKKAQETRDRALKLKQIIVSKLKED